jgi:hypothetical protein
MINANGALATAVSVDKLADDSIPLSVLATGKIPLKLERFDEELDDDDLDIYASVAGVGLVQIAYVPLGPIADRTDPIIIELDASQFLELPQPATPTQYQVQVIVYKGGGGTDDPSNVVTFSIDRTAPFEVKYPSRRKNPPSPAPAFVNAPADTQRLVNEAWMRDAANANLNCTVSVAYPLRRLDDELTVSLTSNGTSIEVFKGTVPATGVFTFANTELRKLPNGRVTITYLWKDLPGNISAPSVAAAYLTLGLALDPKLNKPPLVPVTDPDGTTPIYLDDFFADIVKGIVERVPIDNLESGDTVKLLVEDALDPTNFVEYGPLPITNADVPFPFSYADFATLFGTSTEAMEVKAWAEVIRGASSFASPELFFWMDLYPSGGIFPELPDLTNPSFVLPVVTGASNTSNQLLPGDRDKPGKFKVTLALLDPPVTPAETVKCYVNDVQVGGDFTPFVDATVVEVDISAAVISALNTPTAEARWTRQKTGINKNVISSNPQTVAVGSKKIDLLTPAVKVRNPELKNQIDCFAMINATTAWQLGVLIPEDLVNLPIGKDIVVHFAAYKDLSGTDLIPGTEASTPYTIKAAVKLVVTPARTGRPEISFMGNHAGVGEAATFKLAQPKRGETAFGKYWYTADIGGEQTSMPITMPLDSITSSGEYCDRLPVPAAV